MLQPSGDLRRPWGSPPHPTSASLGSGPFPARPGRWDGGEPGGGWGQVGRSLNELQPQPEAESEMMGAGVGVVTAEVSRRQGDGVSVGQAWEWAGRGGVLGLTQAMEWF